MIRFSLLQEKQFHILSADHYDVVTDKSV